MRYGMRGATLLLVLHGCNAPETHQASEPCLSPGVVAAVLEAPAVAAFLHQELPERDPLKIAGPGLAGGVPIHVTQLRLSGVSGTAAAAPDVFQFLRCAPGGAGVVVEFRLRAEGMRGSAALRRIPGGGSWQIETVDVREE
jgi:hypothetical protein